MNIVHKSAIDLWIFIALLCGPIFIGIRLITEYSASGSVSLLNVLSMLVLGVVYCVFIVPIRYTLETEALVIRFGVFTRRIPYQAVTTVSFSSEFWSSPALALKRIKIQYANTLFGSILISPRARSQFLDDLNARLPTFKRQDDALVEQASANIRKDLG
jgi:hypothetical protein